jgi:hypothetical protein
VGDEDGKEAELDSRLRNEAAHISGEIGEPRTTRGNGEPYILFFHAASPRPLVFSQEHVKSSAATMFYMRFVHARDKRPKLRLAKPQRKTLTQHTALTGNHQNELVACRLRTEKKPQQRAIGAIMGKSVQIEPRFGFEQPAPEVRIGMTADRCRRLLMIRRLAG